MDVRKFIVLVNKSLKHKGIDNKKSIMYLSPIIIEVMNYGFDNMNVAQRYVYKKYVRSFVSKAKDLINLGSLSEDAKKVNFWFDTEVSNQNLQQDVDHINAYFDIDIAGGKINVSYD